MKFESVNVGRVVDVPWGSLKKSAIDKRPAQGRVKVHRPGLGGDEIADLKHHGGAGAYLRVIEAGELAAGDDLDVIETRDHDLSVTYTFRAVTTQRDLLPALAQEPRCSVAIKRELEKPRMCDLPRHRLV